MSRQPEAKSVKSVSGGVSSLSLRSDVSGEDVLEKGEEEPNEFQVRGTTVNMVKGKVPAYPMTGEAWRGVQADAEDEDENQLIPAIVYLWVQRDGPTAVDIVKDHSFACDATRAESTRLATLYDDGVQSGGVHSLIRSATWKDNVLEWLATLKLGDPDWSSRTPFEWGPRQTWGARLVDAKVPMMRRRIARLSGRQLSLRETTPNLLLQNSDMPANLTPQLSLPTVESVVQVLREADALDTVDHREVRVEVTAVPTQEGHDVTVGAADANRRCEDDKITWRTKLSVRKYKAWKKKHLPPVPMDTIIEIDRVQVNSPKEWLVSNVHVLTACDGRGVQAASQSRHTVTRPKGRQRRRCIAQVWRGKPNETPKDLSLVTCGRVNDVKADLIFDTAAQVSVISERVYAEMGSPALHSVDAVATAANGSNLKLLGALSVNLTIGNKIFPYRVWVIDGLRSDALIGLDFMDQYPTVIDTGLKLVAVDGESVPIRLVDWNQRLERQQRRPIDVVVMLPATVPSQMGLELPVRVATTVPARWRERTMLFTPARDFAACARLEVANVIVTGSQAEFYVRVANFGKVPVNVEAGFVIGTVTPMKRDVRVSALRVSADEPAIQPQAQTSGTEFDAGAKSPMERAAEEPLPVVHMDVTSAEDDDGMRRHVRSVVLRGDGSDLRVSVQGHRTEHVWSTSEKMSTDVSLVESDVGMPEIERSKDITIVRLLLKDSRPVPTTSGLESDLGRRTQNETSPKESADSSGLGIVHDREGGLWSPEVLNHEFSARLMFASVAGEAKKAPAEGGYSLSDRMSCTRGPKEPEGQVARMSQPGRDRMSGTRGPNEPEGQVARMSLPGRVDCVVVDLDKAPGDGVNPGGESRIAREVALDQSLDVASVSQEREGRVTLDEQPLSGAVNERSLSDAQRERATNRLLSSRVVDSVEGVDQVVRDDPDLDSKSVTNGQGSGEIDPMMVNDQMNEASDAGLPEKSSSDIPADQHRWTEEQFRKSH